MFLKGNVCLQCFQLESLSQRQTVSITFCCIYLTLLLLGLSSQLFPSHLGEMMGWVLCATPMVLCSVTLHVFPNTLCLSNSTFPAVLPSLCLWLSTGTCVPDCTHRKKKHEAKSLAFNDHKNIFFIAFFFFLSSKTTSDIFFFLVKFCFLDIKHTFCKEAKKSTSTESKWTEAKNKISM